MDRKTISPTHRRRIGRVALAAGLAASAVLTAAGAGSATSKSGGGGGVESDDARPSWCSQADASQLPHTADAIAGWFERCYERPVSLPRTADSMESWQGDAEQAAAADVGTSAPAFGTAAAAVFGGSAPDWCPPMPDPESIGGPWVAQTDECPISEWWTYVVR
jgi:hypothetical protein